METVHGDGGGSGDSGGGGGGGETSTALTASTPKRTNPQPICEAYYSSDSNYSTNSPADEAGRIANSGYLPGPEGSPMTMQQNMSLQTDSRRRYR